jgi:pantothenate kinase type III
LSGDHKMPLLLLTGGDAAVIAPWLATRPEICPNLVIEGLALMFEQRNLR